MMENSRVLYVVLFLIYLNSCQSQNGVEYGEENFLKVTKVIDGDTFWVADGSEKGIKVRLIGVDAPESRNVFKKKKGYYGTEAKAFVTQLISDSNVRLEFDVNQFDQYGRTLAYVYLQDGTFLNAKLVKEGYAVVMTVPPNVKHVDDFIMLQRDARENERGLWGIEVE